MGRDEPNFKDKVIIIGGHLLHPIGRILQRRNLLKLTAASLCAVPMGLGLKAAWFDSELPALDHTDLQEGVTIPDFPTGNHFLASEEPPHILINEKQVKAAMTAKAEASFAFAEKHGLIPLMTEVSKITQLPLSALMCVTCFESNMGKDLVVKTANNSPHQTAHGIAQITEETFIYQIAKHQDLLGKHGRLHRDPDAEAMLAALKYVKFDPYSGKPVLDTMAYAQKRKKTDLPNLENQLARGRNNPFVSLLMVAADLKSVEPHIGYDFPPEASNAKFRFVNWLGLQRTKEIFALCNNKPSATMQEACGFDKTKPDDARWSYFANNGIHPKMRVDDFVALTAMQCEIVQGCLDNLYKAYEDSPSKPTRRHMFGLKKPHV